MITLDEDGTVVEVSAPANLNSLPGVEFHSGMLIPGMVNAHTHLELSYLRGSIPERCGFAGFAAALREQRERFSQREIAEAIDFHDARMWAEGVQAAGDICNGNATFAAKSRSRIAYHSFVELFGLGAGAAQARRAQQLRDEAIGSGLRGTVTAHSTYSLNEEGFALAVGGDDNFPLSIHFMESPGEAELYRGRGEIWQWYDETGLETDFTSRYGSPAERIVKLVPRERKVLLVHGTLMGERETEMLCAHFGGNLTFVLCPLSNRFITGLTPPFELLERSGARIAVGTDSLASNHALSMVGEFRAGRGLALD
jgi:cytosine/adenosine deaminase-related metal-dependent hydrolase